MQKKNVITLGLISTLACGGILVSTMLGSGASIAKATTNDPFCAYITTSENFNSNAYSGTTTSDLNSTSSINNVCTVSDLTIGTDITITGWSNAAHVSNTATTYAYYPFKIGGSYDAKKGDKRAGSFTINLLNNYKCDFVSIWAAGWAGDNSLGLSINDSDYVEVSSTTSGSTTLSPTKYTFSFDATSTITLKNYTSYATTSLKGRICVTKIGLHVYKTA